MESESSAIFLSTMTAIATTLLGLGAVVSAFFYTRKSRQVDAHIRAGEVLAYLAHQPDDSGGEHTVCVIENRTARDVRDISVKVSGANVARLESLPPGQARLDVSPNAISFSQPLSEMNSRVTLTFSDPEGVQWENDVKGIREVANSLQVPSSSATALALVTLGAAAASLTGALISLLK